MEPIEGLIHAFILDGQGGGEEIGWDRIRSWSPEQGFLWVHLQSDQSLANDWLSRESGLDELLLRAILDTNSNPRLLKEGNGILTTLRGINFNRGADPEDMAFLNIWLDENRAITVRQEKLKSVQDIYHAISIKKGPVDGPGLLIRLLDRLFKRMEPILDHLEQELDNIEIQSSKETNETLADKLLDLRHEVIELRRHLIPQHRALEALYNEPIPWIKKVHKRWVREKSNQLLRFLADLESFRDRAVVMQDEIRNSSSERMNRAMYMLSVLTGIFLPMGFLTGLLGINVGGMPGVEYKWAFWIVCTLLVFMVAINIWVFRRMKWI
ncbi:MAG: zinc transporter ZntB [Magnetococcales bacterium]|nr:zinc transporter ZntB [Magnetococcales bacterium]